MSDEPATAATAPPARPAGAEARLSDLPRPQSAIDLLSAPPVHPDSARLFSVCGGCMRWIRRIPVFGQAIEAYGPKMIGCLDVTEFLNKGIAYYTLQGIYQPMFVHRWSCTTLEYQRYGSVSLMGWSTKPVIALVTDAFALFGYTKRWVLVISAVLAFVFTLLFGLLPATHASAPIGAAFAFILGFFMANIDILSEGLYSRKMRKLPAPGPSLVSSLWVVLNTASIIAAFISGPLADAGKEEIGAYISCVCIFLCAPFFVVNWFDERHNVVERTEDYIRDREYHLELREAEALAEGGAPAPDTHDGQGTGEALAALSAVEHVYYEAKQAEVGAAAAQEPAALSDDLTAVETELSSYVLSDGGDPSGHRALVEANPYMITELDHAARRRFLDIHECSVSLCGRRVTVAEYNRQVITRNWRIAVYGSLMTVCVIANAISSIIGNTWGMLATAAGCSVLLTCVSFWALPLVIAKASLFAFLNSLLYIQITAPVYAFYLAPRYNDDGSVCLMDGPHFTYFFYNTIATVIGSVASVFGVIAFNYIFARRSYRITFILTTLSMILGSVFDVIIVERLNIKIGIPDHAMYLWGDAVVYNAAYMLAWMPMVVLISQLCPRGSESLVYALLAGFSNMGQSTSQQVGYMLMDFAFPTTACEFGHNLTYLLIVCHLAAPLLQLPLVFLLIPAARVCDELDPNGKVIGVKGEPRAAPVSREATEQPAPNAERSVEPCAPGDGPQCGNGRESE